MKHFISRLLQFLSPVFILFVLVLMVALYIGDALPIPIVISWQQRSDQTLVYQPWSSQSLLDYKFETIRQRQSSLLIMGSSRMTFFRAALANQVPERFYNAGVPSTSIYQWNNFLQALIADDLAPDVIILGLDIMNYNDNNNQIVDASRPLPITFRDNFVHIYSNTRRVSRHWVSNSPLMLEYLQIMRQDDPIQVGLQVMTSERGFLDDGSRYIINFDIDINEVLERENQFFETRTRQFNMGNSINDRALAVTENFLLQAEEHNIEIIAILPPYHSFYWEAMQDSGDFTYVNDAVVALETLFANYNVPLYDLTDPSRVGGTASEMSDSFHFTDLLSLRIYHFLLLQHPELLEDFSDISVLETWIPEYQNEIHSFFLVDLP